MHLLQHTLCSGFFLDFFWIFFGFFLDFFWILFGFGFGFYEEKKKKKWAGGFEEAKNFIVEREKK